VSRDVRLASGNRRLRRRNGARDGASSDVRKKGVKAVTASKMVLDSIGLRDRPERPDPGVTARTDFGTQVQVGFRPRNGTTFRLSIRPTTIVRACADNGLASKAAAAESRAG
jgi:hypothetical protein